MIGSRTRDQLEFFVCGSLRDLVPDDHILARVDQVLDLGWLRGEVADLYASGVGRPGIDPEAAVRLMLTGFLLGIVHDRRLMREAQVNLAIRWFAGFGLNDRLPDHSSLTRIRQRWGPDRFRRIFERIVRACIDAKIAKGEVVHVDASLIRADVAWESLAVRHVEAVEGVNGDDTGRDDEGGGDEVARQALRHSRKSGKFRKVCLTDPDASMATSGRNRRLEPSYKQHGAVDDECGVILDVEVTTGEVNEGQEILSRLDAVAAVTGAPIGTVTADAGYAYAKVFAGLEDREIIGVIPTKAEPIESPAQEVPLRRTQRHRQMPEGQGPDGPTRRRSPMAGSSHRRHGTAKAATSPISACRRRASPSPSSSSTTIRPFFVPVADDFGGGQKTFVFTDATAGGPRAFTARRRPGMAWRGAVRRGLDNMRIQAFLTAAAINLKRLAAALLAMICTLIAQNAARAWPIRA